jgi:hypothetical protein
MSKQKSLTLLLCTAFAFAGCNGVIGDEDDSDTRLKTAHPTAERPSHGVGKPLAVIGGQGRLEYGRYANIRQNNAVHILPDFSHAGYRGVVSRFRTSPCGRPFGPKAVTTAPGFNRRSMP